MKYLGVQEEVSLLFMFYESIHVVRADSWFTVCVTSSSTAEAESLSASLVRQGKALKTVSTEMHRPQRGMNHGDQRLHSDRLLVRISQLLSDLWGQVTLTLCIGVPSTSQVSHHLTGGQVTMEVLKRIKKQVTWSFTFSAVFSNLVFKMWLLFTISSRTLLDTATLKGWNLLMAEKADNSTSVCGSLREKKMFGSL